MAYFHNMKPWAQLAFVFLLIAFLLFIYLSPTYPQASVGVIGAAFAIFFVLLIGRTRG